MGKDSERAFARSGAGETHDVDETPAASAMASVARTHAVKVRPAAARGGIHDRAV